MSMQTVTPSTELPKAINREHQLFEQAARSAVVHAQRAGELLVEAKAQVAHGQWLPWVREHCEFSERMAQVYMRVARELPQLPDPDAKHVADLPLRQVLAALAEPTLTPDRSEDQDDLDDPETLTNAPILMVPVDSIEVGLRRRQSLGDLLSLMKSIQANSLLHPIVIDDRNRLCAGARRLAAVKALGETHIETRSAGRISNERLRAIELGEQLWKALTPSELHWTPAKTP